MKNKPILSVVIVSYNTCDLTRQAIESVQADANRSELQDKIEILVVDNHSQDDSVKMLEQLDLTLIENQTNPGFAAANNQAINQATGSLILLLNSDTIVQPGALKSLIQTFQKQTAHPASAYSGSSQAIFTDRLGIVAAHLLNADGTDQHQGGSFPSLLSVFFQMSLIDDLPIVGTWLPSTQKTTKLLTSLTPAAWVSGAAMTIKREVIEEIGLFDDEFFMYGEDTEFCLRAHHHHWNVAIQPQAKIIHLGSASSSSADALKGEFRGLIYIWAKHKPLWQMSVLKALLYLGAYLRILLFGTILKQPEKAKNYREIVQIIRQS